MRPRVPVLLIGAAGKIGEVAALLDDAYAAYEMRMVAAMNFLLLQDYDRGPARRVEEIDAISALLRRGAGLAPAGLAATLRGALDAADAKAGELTMSALDDRLDAVRRGLIDLQAWLEESSDADSAALLAEVWAELRAQVRRRTVSLG